jgi:hypothetical protein
MADTYFLANRSFLLDHQLPLCYGKPGISVMSPIPIVRNSKLQDFGASKEVKRKFSRKLRISTFSTTMSVPWGVI